MIKIVLISFLSLLAQSSYSVEIDNLDIESHPQSSFPSINLSIGDKSVEYYGMDSAQEGNLKFVKQDTQLKGEVAISGYIFAKEFVESFRIPNTIANKKKKSEFVEIFNEKDPSKFLKVILSINEKWRTSETPEELEKIIKIIKKEKTPDSPDSTPFFPTGFIELKSPKGNNERYFINLADINKTNVTLTTDKSKINLLKSVTIYSFQNILSNLNFGDIEKDSVEDKLFKRLENLNFSICSFDCPIDFTKDLSSLALKVGKIVTFQVLGDNSIENMDDFNKYLMAQQWCVLNNFSESCHVKALDDEINDLALNPIIKGLIQKHNSAVGLCKFLQK
jgi:hypothetical protein